MADSPKQATQSLPQSVPLLSELTAAQRDAAMTKYRLIEPFFNQEQTLTQLCQEKKLPVRTASHWVARFRQCGLVGLARKTRNDQGVRRACSSQITTFIEGLYLQKPHLSVSANLSTHL